MHYGMKQHYFGHNINVTEGYMGAVSTYKMYALHVYLNSLIEILHCRNM